MAKQDVILVDIIGSVVSAMEVTNVPYINYEPGRSAQVLDSLQIYDNAVVYEDKGLKYPLIAMLMPIPERKGGSFPSSVVIPRIVIAVMSTTDGGVKERYGVDQVFKTQLYPMYNEFLKRLALSVYTNQGDPEMFVHTKIDNPDKRPIGDGMTDFVDTIEILNLELILNQIKTC